MISLICVWINGWVNNCEAGDFRRHRGHYDVNVIRWLEWNCDFRKEQPCKVRFRQFIRTTNSQNTTHSSAAKVRYGRVLYIMTSSNGNIFRVTGLCAGNSPGPVNSPHKGQWRGALMFSLICGEFMFSLICVWINDWVNNCDTGDLRRHRGHCDVIVMICKKKSSFLTESILFTL